MKRNSIKLKLKSQIKNVGQSFSQGFLHLAEKLEKNIRENSQDADKVLLELLDDIVLGKILRVNNLKSGICSYNCTYCSNRNIDLITKSVENQISPFTIYYLVKEKLARLQEQNIHIDYIEIKGTGETSLDSNLRSTITLLREFGYKIIVRTNASLLWNFRVRENLMFPDLVILKLDTVNPESWAQINRPHRRLQFDLVLRGIRDFSNTFPGELYTETTIVKGINDSMKEINALAAFLNSINRRYSIFKIPSVPANKKLAEFSESELKILSIFIESEITNSILLCCPEFTNIFSSDNLLEQVQAVLNAHPIEKNIIVGIENSEFTDWLKAVQKENRITTKVVASREFILINN